MRIDLTARRYSSGPPPGVGDLWLCSSPLQHYFGYRVTSAYN